MTAARAGAHTPVCYTGGCRGLGLDNQPSLHQTRLIGNFSNAARAADSSASFFDEPRPVRAGGRRGKGSFVFTSVVLAGDLGNS